MQRRISAQEAINIALERLPGEVVDVELDTEQGILVWEIEILTPQGVKYEVYVNANTGEIVKVELD
ncbi:PepSY domain-containing protein [Salipaludibacillus agaradhaerens]|nr:PepSY domain-containing protein [Salipaludibacillus agaradhaerens]MCR6118175.1 PepSY domain-containing protein [Salipaludibacillus agaradhaerens]UJW59693.1 PepSY domain-containing protein [Bacillus sp. A116_S68]